MAPPRLTLAQRIEGAVGRFLGHLPPPLQRALAGGGAVAVEGQVLDPALQLVGALRRRRGVPGYCDPTVPVARERLRREAAMYRGPVTGVGAVRELAVDGAAGPLPARHYAPAVDGAAPLLVYFHGGGFSVCDLDTHDEPCRLLCRHAGTHVLSVGYRLAPEHPFPAALDDARAALRWAQASAASLGADPRRVSVGGDSAGGNLAAVVSRRATREGAPPFAQLLVYPSTDVLTRRASHELFGTGYFLDQRDRDLFFASYTGGRSRREPDPDLSPLLARDLQGLPPALVVVAHFDVLRDEGEAYAAALADAGNVVRIQRVPTLGHAFINMTGVSRTARAEMLRMARLWRELVDGTPAHGLPAITERHA